MPLVRHWVNASIRDIYDSEAKEFPDKGFTKTIRIDGLYYWDYNRNLDGRTRKTTDTDVYVTDGFLRGSYDGPLHLTDWKLPPLAFWLFEEKVYAAEGHDLAGEDVHALVNVAANKRRLLLEKAHALQAMTDRLDERIRRERIPQQVKLAVWQRDGGRCVECDQQEKLEFDHVIPLAMGGSNTERNLQLLCETCNRRKGATLG